MYFIWKSKVPPRVAFFMDDGVGENINDGQLM